MTSLPLYYRSASQLRILSFKPIPPRLHELSCLYLTKICESLVGNIRSSSGIDEFIMASSPMYVVPFINGINQLPNETRDFSTQHVGVRRPIPRPEIPPSFPSHRRFWIPWRWSSTSQVTPTPPTRRMRVWGATHLKKYIFDKIKLDDFPVGRGWK